MYEKNFIPGTEGEYEYYQREYWRRTPEVIKAEERQKYSDASEIAEAAEKYADLVARTKVEPAYENAHRANLAQAKVEAAIARTRAKQIAASIWPVNKR